MVKCKNLLTVQGFTLIELLVIVLIIGILAAVAVPQYKSAVERSRTVQIISLLRNWAQEEEAYLMANGDYAEKDTLIEMGAQSVPSKLSDWGWECNAKKDSNLWFAYCATQSGNVCRIIFFMENQPTASGANGQTWKGRQVCLAKKDSAEYNAFCQRLSGQDAISYPWQSDRWAYLLN